TYESIGRPLPGRKSVVITRRADLELEGVTVAGTIEEAIAIAERAGDDEAFVAGGAEIFRQTLDRADRLYLTLIHAEIEGDARFPEIDETRWRQVARENHDADERNAYAFSFVDFEAVGRTTASI
ncbi:MAG: dihydrofolate reductase, partial [Acidobacteriota bacterium]|nr:dihydrofolate reductase [Acidobacteriota bacterium]